MGVRVVFPDMGKDPSIQLIEKTITENGTYDALTDGANGYSKVNVNVEGGGSSSDFSTATVTIIGRGSETATQFSMPIVDDRREGIRIADTVPASTKTYIVPLYKGKGYVKVTAGDITDITGEATDDRGNLIITGDCSFVAYYRQL